MATTGVSREAVTALAGLLTGGAGPAAVVSGACQVVADATGAARVSVLVCRDSGAVAVLGSSDDVGWALSAWQVRERHGPAVEVCRLGRPVVAPSIDSPAARGWSRYAARARESGVHSLWCVPVAVGGRLLGAMEGHGSGALGDDAAADVRALATVVGVLLLRSVRVDRAEHLAARLERTLHDRVTVEQAAGRLAERHGIEVGEALALLGDHARTHGHPLHEVAGEVVEGRLFL